jgi:hypothetical protein
MVHHLELPDTALKKGENNTMQRRSGELRGAENAR